MKYFITFLFLLLSLVLKAVNVDSLLYMLDQTLAERKQYIRNRQNRIILLQDNLSKQYQEKARYEIQRSLYLEYKTFIADSALYYADDNLKIASDLDDVNLIHRALLDKASILISSGLFLESSDLLKKISVPSLNREMLIDYYVAYENLYLFQAEYAMNQEYMNDYLLQVSSYRDSILSLVPSYSYQYVIVKAPQLLEQWKREEATQLLKGYLQLLKPDTREYAVVASILAFAYHLEEQKDEEIEARIKSAIADVQSAVKENYSLCALAELLYERGDIERANRYIKLSLADAYTFSTRLRSLQSAKMLPIIDRAYEEEKAKQQSRLIWLIMGVSILSLFLLMTIYYVIKQMKKLSKTRRKVLEANKELNRLNSELKQLNKNQTLFNERLLLTNRHLCEANHIKEEYLGRFLSLNSYYIGKLEDYRKTLNRMAANGKLDDLYKMLKSDSYTHAELRDFYHNFDISFLKIYPNFVSEFNKLLPEGEGIYPKNDELLTTELRIFALIRLGISDSARIAEFLRCSITTIYTYRSKLKKKSICKEDFESKLMEISSL